MKIILFGTGCNLCREIAANIETAIISSPCPVNFEKTSDLSRMLGYGIQSTPSVVMENQVVSVSKPLSVQEITILIETYCAKIKNE